MSVAPQVENMQRKSAIFNQLGKVKSISIDQKVDTMETLFQNIGLNFVENSNKYSITFDRSTEGQTPDLIAVENSGVLCRWCCKPIHPVEIEYYKPSGTQPEPYVSKKPFRCFECINCCNICAATVTTELQGQEIGQTTERACTGLTPILDMTVSDQNSGSISGPSCCLGDLLLRKLCCRDQDPTPFELIREESKGPRSTIYTKRLNNFKQDDNVNSSLVRAVTDADNYTITFAQNMTPQEKLHMISSVLLVDYLFYEQDGSNLSQGLYCGMFYCNGCIIPCRCSCNNNDSSN